MYLAQGLLVRRNSFGWLSPGSSPYRRDTRQCEQSLIRRGIVKEEVTNISKHGFWILIHGREMFLPFGQFPWFKDSSVGALLNVKLTGPDHLYWPDLDVDLSVESIDHPERFPLVSKVRSPTAPYRIRRAKRS